MSDDFLSRLREEPRPEFAGRLEERLREIDARERERRLAPGPFRRFAPALAGASLVAALAFAFTLEPVRAAAREFLGLPLDQLFSLRQDHGSVNIVRATRHTDGPPSIEAVEPDIRLGGDYL